MNLKTKIIISIICVLTVASLGLNGFLLYKNLKYEDMFDYIVDDYTNTYEEETGKITFGKPALVNRASQNPEITTKAKIEAPEGNESWAKEYDNIEDAWNVLNAHTDCDATIHIYDNWVAHHNGTTKKSYFGEGAGFSENGSIAPVSRGEHYLKVYLHENTIDFALDSANENGSVFILENIDNFELHDATVTGGATTGKGGGFYINNVGTIGIYNCVITVNYAIGNGGGIFIGPKCGTVLLQDVIITGNISESYGGGIYESCPWMGNNSALNLENKIVINENIGKYNMTDLVLRVYGSGCATVGKFYNLSENSKINVTRSDSSEGVVGILFANDRNKSNYKIYFKTNDENLKFSFEDNLVSIEKTIEE